MKLIRTKGLKQWMKIHKLYKSAFPADERKPFALIWKAFKSGKVDIWSLQADGNFIGFAITMKDDNKVLLDYFAISDDKRSCGYGGKAIKLLQEYYKDKKFFLEIESVYTNAKNLDERIRRKKFYLNNGMSEMKLLAKVYGTTLEILGFNCSLTFDEYRSVYLNVYGKHTADNVRSVQFPDGK